MMNIEKISSIIFIIARILWACFILFCITLFLVRESNEHFIMHVMKFTVITWVLLRILKEGFEACEALHISFKESLKNKK